MPEQKVPQEVNKFQGGLNTDASPLTFPEGTASEMENIIIERNGDIRRRLGLDYESSHTTITTAVAPTTNLAVNTYKWDNPGGDFDKALQVIQVGNEIKVFDLDSVPVSAGLIYTYKFTSVAVTTRISFSSIDSFLVAADGTGDISVFEYDPVGESISRTEQRLLVRDFWGVDDIVSSVDLREGLNIIKRPATNPDTHLYNLRNQSFGVGRPTDANDNELLKDPIVEFQSVATTYPSNSDDVNFALYPHAALTNHPLIPRFWPDDLHKNKIGTYEAPKGYFIIDMLNRGTSRIAAEAANVVDNPELTLTVTTLVDDSTAGGATVTAEFAGRAFFAGFGTTTTDGDAKSPKLSSYVAFSRLVRDISDIKNCYQVADPTSGEDSVLVATDGGAIRIDGAYNINGLVPSGDGLLVFAQNGVWRIVGGSDFGFGATNYRVDRISDDGCRSPGSIVFVDGAVVYWGDDGIYKVAPTEVGDWGTQNILVDRIQSLYNTINTSDKKLALGIFDHFERKIRWVYRNSLQTTENPRELIYDVDVDNFTLNTFVPTSGILPGLGGIMKTNPFLADQASDDVEVNGDQVQVNGEDVVILTTVKTSVTKEVLYLAVIATSPFIQYTFAQYNNQLYKDWYLSNTAGTDAAAFIVTGQLTPGDNFRRKKNKNLILHMKRTESGMTTNDAGELVPANQSSVQVQAHWDWATSLNSNRWSVAREYYRPPRLYLPTDQDDVYDTGFNTVVTKDILRGHGKTLSLKLSSSEEKDFHIHGWMVMWGVGDKLG